MALLCLLLSHLWYNLSRVKCFLIPSVHRLEHHIGITSGLKDFSVRLAFEAKCSFILIWKCAKM